MVGNWLVSLSANSETTSRALEYFKEISNLIPSITLRVSKLKVIDITEFYGQLEELIMKIS